LKSVWASSLLLRIRLKYIQQGNQRAGALSTKLDIIRGEGAARRKLVESEGFGGWGWFEVLLGRFFSITLHNIYVKPYGSI